MPTATCPLCNGHVFVGASTELGEHLICDECEENLELVGLDPIELDPATLIPEDTESDFNIFEIET